MPNFKHQKVSGKSSGTNETFKKDGYAKGPVPGFMQGTKVGKTNHKGYTGPSVAQGTLKGQ